jgi:hypothetical protein
VSPSRSYEADFPLKTETPASVAIVVAAGSVPSQRPGTPITGPARPRGSTRGHEGPEQWDRSGDLRILIRRSPAAVTPPPARSFHDWVTSTARVVAWEPRWGSRNGDAMVAPKSEVIALLDRRSEAMQMKDIDRLMPLYSPDIVYFDILSLLCYVGTAAGQILGLVAVGRQNWPGRPRRECFGHRRCRGGTYAYRTRADP